MTADRPSLPALVWCAISMALVVVAAGCGSGFDRGSALESLSADVIVPAYLELADDTSTLADAAEQFCAAPSDDGLAAVRDGLIGARASWSYTEPMWIGPVMERRSWAVIDWPISESEIEELIADTDVELDVDRVGQRIGADQRGLGAVEYMVGGPSADDVLASFADPRRCDYLVAVARVVGDEAAMLPIDWSTDFERGGPWSATLAADADGSVDALVNDSVFLLEAMGDAELGTALGEMERAQDVEAVVEGPLGQGVPDLANHLAGLRAVYLGGAGSTETNSLGLTELLGEDLADRLGDQFDAAQAAVDRIEGPLRTAAVEQPAVVAEARNAIKVIQVTVMTDVVSRLGVTIGFSDADGDTGG